MKYNLFNINKYDIDCSNFNHLLCDDVNAELEEKFAKYVGAKYACVANSASSLLFVCLDITKRMLTRYSSDKKEAIRMNPVFLPSIIPPAVANVVHNSGMMGIWTDNVDWVGSSYVLYDFAKSVCSKNSIEINANFESKGYKIIDSAQEVRRNQFEEDSCSQGDLMVFSFYPTKPVGGIDGGIVVSNDEGIINHIRSMVNLGSSESTAKDSFLRANTMAGWKMNANSAQCYYALQNLNKLDDKNEKISSIREMYNDAFNLENKSCHLYTIDVKDRVRFMNIMKKNEIQTGVHYNACHRKRFYNIISPPSLPLSEGKNLQTVSIPLNETLTKEDAGYIIGKVKESELLIQK